MIEFFKILNSLTASRTFFYVVSFLIGMWIVFDSIVKIFSLFKGDCYCSDSPQEKLNDN